MARDRNPVVNNPENDVEIINPEAAPENPAIEGLQPDAPIETPEITEAPVETQEATTPPPAIISQPLKQPAIQAKPASPAPVVPPMPEGLTIEDLWKLCWALDQKLARHVKGLPI